MSDLRFPTDHGNGGPDDEFESAVSSRFGEALRAGVIAAGLSVPQRVDDAVMSAARSRLADVASGYCGRTSPGWTLRRAAACGAMAASLALAAVLAMPRPHAGDVNQDGSVDILDAYRLARSIERSSTNSAGSLPGGADVNGDGIVDQRDVQWIAQHSVRLPEGTG